MPIIMGTMAALGALNAIAGNSQAKADAKARNTAIEANMKANVMNANYTMAEMTRQQQVASDAATEQLIQQRIVAMENEGAVAAAASETGVEGNSMETAGRSVSARYARSAASIMANVDREIMGLQSQMETVARDTNAQNKMAAMGAVAKPSGAQQLLNVGAGALQGASMGMEMDSTFSMWKKDSLKVPSKTPSNRSRLGKDNR